MSSTLHYSARAVSCLETPLTTFVTLYLPWEKACVSLFFCFFSFTPCVVHAGLGKEWAQTRQYPGLKGDTMGGNRTVP